MNNPAISVIIPVYNTDIYLNDAVGSILNQTFRDIELIIVNDGSTDNSLNVLKEFENSDSRVILIDQPNSGSSIARELALGVSKGEYLFFMDSDDILDLNALECCYNRAVKDSLDMVFFDAVSFSDDANLNAQSFHYNRKGVVGEGIYNGAELMNILLGKDLFRVAPWMHLFKKELATKNELHFYPRIIHEDELFFSQLYLFAKRVGYIPKDFFSRRLRANSTMTTKFSLKNINSYFTIVKELEKTKERTTTLALPVIDKLISDILSGVAYQTGMLTFNTRVFVLKFILKNGYIGGVKIKSILVLLFPFTLYLKSTIIKPTLKLLKKL
ncbi:MAG: glycosyltransferase [Bacteroidales bacterium]|nr:glycosyltransferase [Bacteroidales bacterium]